MAIQAISARQVQLLGENGYYLKHTLNEKSESVWKITHLNCIQRFFRFLGCCHRDTHLKVVVEHLMGEGELPIAFKERMFNIFDRSYPGLENPFAVRVEAVLEAIQKPGPLIEAGDWKVGMDPEEVARIEREANPVVLERNLMNDYDAAFTAQAEEDGDAWMAGHSPEELLLLGVDEKEALEKGYKAELEEEALFEPIDQEAWMLELTKAELIAMGVDEKKATEKGKKEVAPIAIAPEAILGPRAAEVFPQEPPALDMPQAANIDPKDPAQGAIYGAIFGFGAQPPPIADGPANAQDQVANPIKQRLGEAAQPLPPDWPPVPLNPVDEKVRNVAMRLFPPTPPLTPINPEVDEWLRRMRIIQGIGKPLKNDIEAPTAPAIKNEEPEKSVEAVEGDVTPEIVAEIDKASEIKDLFNSYKPVEKEDVPVFKY